MLIQLKQLLAISILLFGISRVKAQTIDSVSISQKYSAVSIGQSVPAIPLNNIKNMTGKERTLADFKGKLVIIDFWTTGCPGCIRGFPKMKELQDKFEDQIQVLLINPWETEAKVQERLNGSLKDFRLNTATQLPTIVGDSVWRLVFPHLLVPHHIWIGKDGKLIAQTTGNSTNASTVAKVLRGEKVYFVDKQDNRNFDKNDDALITLATDSMSNLNYYSMFLPYNPGLPGGSSEVTDTLEKTYRISFRNTAIAELYAISSPNPGAPVAFETNDTSDGQPKYEDDRWVSANLFSYELKVPLVAMPKWREHMFADLNRYLGAERKIAASIQERKHLTFILCRSALPKAARVKTGNKHKIKTLEKSYLFINEKHIVLQNALKARLGEQLGHGALFVDESAIAGDALTTFELPSANGNVELLQFYLNKHGLDLKTEERTVETLVIQDKTAGL